MKIDINEFAAALSRQSSANYKLAKDITELRLTGVLVNNLITEAEFFQREEEYQATIDAYFAYNYECCNGYERTDINNYCDIRGV
jgi:hypothetical protein